MFTMKNYVQATSLAEAYDLRKKSKQNIILGGNLWLKMGKREVNTGIDLCNLGLNTITETEDAYVIGCMCTLHQLETNPSLHEAFQGSFLEAVRHIVGVPFRNTATVGGSVFPRFGFSDVLTLFAALDTYVELYHGGILPIKEFIEQKPDEDILVNIIVKKDGRKVIYQSQRMTETDFAVLTCAVSVVDDNYRVVLGATPHKAKIVEAVLCQQVKEPSEVERFIEQVIANYSFDSNMRGSAEYRKAMAKVLLRRGLAALAELEG